jgi:hypothetical protein
VVGAWGLEDGLLLGGEEGCLRRVFIARGRWDAIGGG